MKEKLKNLIILSISNLGPINKDQIEVEHPDDISNGDYSTNIALVLAKSLKKNPLPLSIEIAEAIEKNISNDQELKKYIERVEVAGIGFINFYLSREFFAESLKEIMAQGENFGRNSMLKGKKVAIEYTDPNPFKQFHIGHLMTNVIGEALANLHEWNGAEVKRFCYQGDVGRHVALTLWGLRFMKGPIPSDTASLTDKTKFLGEAYALASKKIKEEPELESEIKVLNKKIYDRSDAEVNDIYDKGREWSLEHFEELYEILGTKFDQYFFESVTSVVGIEIVKKNTPQVFKESEGAIIFPGEEHDLHTRVFITSDGLPTYETKEIGLAKMKYETYSYEKGLTITGNEQNDYFKVIFKTLDLIFPDIAEKSSHLSHGMLRLSSGKMGSRHGNVVTGESLIDDMIKASFEKMKERPLSNEDKENIGRQVGVGAIKYSILKQSIGKDIIFDKEKSLSFEGDSGPYLQYAHTRATSVLKKAKEEKIEAECAYVVSELIKKLYRFPEIIETALTLSAPQYVVTYLTELASLFNRFYAEEIIVDSTLKESGSRICLTNAFKIVMKNGLSVLGIKVPENM